ncbi:Mce-associated membrane protein [Crossiella equi]|uniref:Mce-associated membrane protein n=1 Tax=Crossiella equi TaxID=130796 RepID=A0ABS5A8Z5_9PSEU|nr:nuclear transport factor 2 family protein [Crossiella equi]MBP2473040.1 Mce-associated membrane protein [Crossiella equi]
MGERADPPEPPEEPGEPAAEPTGRHLDPEPVAPEPASRFPLRAALLTILLLALAATTWATIATATRGAPANQALVDTAATDTVTRQVGDALRDVFTYDHTNTARTEDLATRVLTGRAVEQYRQLFAEVRATAPQQKLVLSTTVRAVGVKELTGDRATLLVLLDQQVLRGSDSSQRSGAAQVEVDARLSEGAWRIAELRVL